MQAFFNRHRSYRLGLPSAVGLWLGMLAIIVCGVTLKAESVQAPQPEMSPRDLHVWGRFDPGTWKRVRIVTETLNERGRVVDTTTTETKTTLLRADAKRLTLRIEATVEVAGKRFENPPQVVEYGYYGESPSDRAVTKSLGSEQLTVDGQQVPCQIRQVVATSGQQQEVTKMYLSDDVEPFVLKRETSVSKDDGKTPGDLQTEVEVIALDMPYRVLRETKSTAYERTIQKTPRGANVTLDVISVEVPGGIVARTTKEMDGQGHLLRRSTLELVDYHVVDDDDDNSASPLTHRQSRRSRRH